MKMVRCDYTAFVNSCNCDRHMTSKEYKMQSGMRIVGSALCKFDVDNEHKNLYNISDISS